MTRSQTLLAVASVAILTGVGASGQSTTPPAEPTLAEIRAMRADLNQRLEANIRVQLLVARLSLQEQRTSVVVRQLADVSEKLRTHEQTKTQMEASTKMLGFSPDKPVDEDENFLAGIFKAQFEQLAKNDAELKQQHAELTSTLAQEQARWAAFSAQLAELERLFDKPKK